MNLPLIDEVSAPPPAWGFAILWVAVFVAPIAVAPDLLAGTIMFVPISAAATGFLLAPYLSRPWVWVRNTVLALGLLATVYGLFFIVFPVLLPGAGVVVGLFQSSAFVSNGENWSTSWRARAWVWVSGLTWLAMYVVPWLFTGEPFRLDMSLDRQVALLAFFIGGAVSCAGMLWILRKVPERRDDASEQPPR